MIMVGGRVVEVTEIATLTTDGERTNEDVIILTTPEELHR